MTQALKNISTSSALLTLQNTDLLARTPGTFKTFKTPTHSKYLTSRVAGTLLSQKGCCPQHWGWGRVVLGVQAVRWHPFWFWTMGVWGWGFLGVKLGWPCRHNLPSEVKQFSIMIWASTIKGSRIRACHITSYTQSDVEQAPLDWYEKKWLANKTQGI